MAGRMADAYLERTGITKGAGSFQREELAARFLPTAVAVTDLVAEYKKISRDAVRRLEENEARIRALAEQAGLVGDQGSTLAGRHVPGAVEIERRFQDLNNRQFGVRLAEAKAPEKMNGAEMEDTPAGWLKTIENN